MPRPTVASRLSAANQQRSTERQNLEDLAVEQRPGNVRGIAVSNDAQGTTLETENGGRIVVPRQNDGPENITPAIGKVYQASVVDAGSVRLQINSRSAEVNAELQQTSNVFYDTRAPINGQDFGKSGDLWGHIQGFNGAYDNVFFWRWLQPVGRWAPINGADESNGQINAPTVNQIISVIPHASYESVITKISLKIIGGATTSSDAIGDNDLTNGLTTITLNANIGDTVAVDGNLEFSITATDGSPFSWSIGYIKI